MKCKGSWPFALSGHMVQNHTCWWASCTVGLPKQYDSYQSTWTCLELLWKSLCAFKAKINGMWEARHPLPSPPWATCLAWRVFVFILRQKWGVCNWCLRLPLKMAEIFGSTQTKTIRRLCVPNSSKEEICLLCAEVITDKDLRRKLMIPSGQK